MFRLHYAKISQPLPQVDLKKGPGQTILTNEGKPAKQVMEYMRHKTHEMYLRYSHVTDETRKATADLLEATIQQAVLRGSA